MAAMLRVSLLLALAACGRLGFDRQSDATVDAAPEVAGNYAPPMYVKPRVSHALARFGSTVTVSDDGRTLVVRAANDPSASSGIGGDDTDASLLDAGAVYVFVRANAGDPWTRQAYIKSSEPVMGELFGFEIELSSDGDRLLVGALGNSGAGRVYVFSRVGTTWSQVDMFTAPVPIAGDNFGISISLSADGELLGVGVPLRDQSRGAVEVYRRNGASYAHLQTVTRPTSAADVRFGATIAMSATGSEMWVGVPLENAPTGGAVYRFAGPLGAWTEQERLEAVVPSRDGTFGDTLVLSRDGSTLAVGASDDDSPGVDAMNDPRSFMFGKRILERGGSADPAAIADTAVNLKDLLSA